MYNFIIIFLVILSSVFSLSSRELNSVSNVYFYVLIIIGVLDYLKCKSLTLFQAWQVAFVFIILSEALLFKIYNQSLLQALQFLIIANNVLILGYLFPVKKRTLKSKPLLQSKENKWLPIVFVFLIGVYTYLTLPGALRLFFIGRTGISDMNSDYSNVLVRLFMSSISLILPSIIVFYYKEIKGKKSLVLPLMLSTPVFLTMLLAGTRFPLLFSFGGFLIIAFAKNFEGKITLNSRVLLFIFLLFSATIFMKSFRALGYGNQSFFNLNKVTDTPLSSQLAAQMSPEGVIDMTALMIRHFERNPHTYGKSISFLTYFWVPRALWPEKPTMLGNWLVREYRSGFSEGHSSSFGFTGELYADFGYLSLSFVFIMGMFLKRLDLYLSIQLAQPGAYQKIIAAMLFPYVFFFVRSPITSTMTFLGILFVYFLMKKILFSQIVLK